MRAVKAHFDGKVFVPDEPVKLPKGRPLLLSVFQAVDLSEPLRAQSGRSKNKSGTKSITKRDPVFFLGKNPVRGGRRDASVNHDALDLD